MARKTRHGGFSAGRPASNQSKRKPNKITFQAELVRANQHLQAGQVAEAEAIYRQIVAKNNIHPQANYSLAMLMEARGLPGQAIEHLKLVVRSQPDNIDVQLGLATILRKLGRNEEALQHFKISAQLNPGLSGVYNNIGNICRELQQVDDAERYLMKAIELDPKAAEAANNLGALYSEQGRVDEAVEFFRLAIANKPDYCKAHRNLATTRKHKKYDKEIEAMECLFDQPGATDFDRMHLGFGLGKAFEELGQNKKAFRYWSVANRCQRTLSPYDIRNGIAEIKTMHRIFSPELLRDASGARSEQVPVFIVGMPRSGTSLTEQILASHSDVYGAGELELVSQLARKVAPQSPEELARLNAADWRRLGGEYLSEIARRAGGERYVVDKLPGNFLYIGMIRMMLAEARIIHCQRDPMDTGLSCFKNHFLGTGLDYTCDLNDLGTYYRYYEALMAYWDQVLVGEIHDSVYEALVGDPEKETGSLLGFFGLPFEDACLSFYETKRMVATASAVQVRQPIHQRSIRKWKNFKRELQPLRDSLEKPVTL